MKIFVTMTEVVAYLLFTSKYIRIEQLYLVVTALLIPCWQVGDKIQVKFLYAKQIIIFRLNNHEISLRHLKSLLNRYLDGYIKSSVG